jgi:hypothetical protein
MPHRPQNNPSTPGLHDSSQPLPGSIFISAVVLGACLGLLLGLLLLPGCHAADSPTGIPSVVYDVSLRDLCTPVIGEDQDMSILVHGHAWNSTTSECI